MYIYVFILGLLIALAGGAIYALRNRLLDAYRGPLQAAVTRAAGREIQLKSVRLDAACRCADVCADVDVAPGWRLEVARARIAGLAALVRGDPAGLVLQGVEGRLVHEGPEAAVTLPFTLEGDMRAGELEVRDGTATHRASGQSLRFSARGRIAVEGSAWSGTALHVECDGATWDGEASGGFSGMPARVAGKLAGVRPGLARAVAAAFAPDARAMLDRAPDDARAHGALELFPDRAVELSVRVESGATQITLTGRAGADGELTAARCAGKIDSRIVEAFVEAPPVSFPTPFEIVVDGRIEGQLARPRVAMTLFCPALRVSDRGAHAVTATLSDATAKLRWEPGQTPDVESLDAALELAAPAGTLSGALGVRAREVAREGHLVRLAAGLAGARFVPRRPPAGAWIGIEARADVDVRADGWSVQDLALGWRGATLAGGLCGPFGGMTWMSLKLDGLDASALRDVLRQVPDGPVLRVMTADAPPGGLPVPPDLRVSGQIGPGPDGVLGCSFTLDTDSSRLFLNGRPEAGAPVGWKLSGRLSPRDVNTMGWFAPVRLDPEGEIFLDLKIEGGPLRLVGPAHSARLEVRGYADASLAPVPVTEISAQLIVGGDEMKWQALQGKLYGGTVTCNGWMGFTSDPFPYVVRVDWGGLAAGQMPMGLSGARLGQYLRATASGSLTVEGKGSDPAHLQGKGEVTLAEPQYLFLKEIGPMLAPYGLPAPPTNGSGPGRAELVLGDRKLVCRGIDVRVPGLSVAGNTVISFAGALAGNLEIDLERQYLSRSALLSLPASFAKTVRIPATLSGTVNTPRWSADITGSLSNFMKNYEFGDITKGILENYELGSLTKGVFDVLRRTAGGSEKPPSAELDRMFDHILAGGARTDQYLEKLIQSGYSADDIKSMLADHRRRGRRS
jgi:hypothetical protein